MLNFGYPLNKELKSKLDFYAFNYCYPYFFQDWRLFTPSPKNNFTIYAVYKIKNQTHYTLPLQEILHQHHLFTGREFMMLSVSASAGYVQAEDKPICKGIYKMKLDKAYFIFKHVITNYLNKKHQASISNLHLTLALTNTKTKQTNFLVDR